MKKIFLLSFLILTYSSLFSQDNSQETLFGGDEIRIGGYGGPEVKYKSINNELGLFVGGRGGLIVNSNFTLGIAGYGLVTSHTVPDYKIRSSRVSDSSAYLRMGYGGLHLGYSFEPNKIIHINAGVLIGAGGAAYTTAFYKEWDDGGYDNSHRTFESSAFFVTEPHIGAELNILKFMRMEISAGYLYVSGLKLPNTKNEDLSGFTGNLIFKFGKF